MRVSFSVAIGYSSACRGMLLGVWVLAVLSVTTWSPAAHGATINVDVKDNFFSPSVVNIKVGDTVVWTWRGSGFHNVVGGTFSSGSTKNSGSFSRTFNSVGSFGYVCTPHAPSMSGTVVVSAADTTAPTPNPMFFSTLPRETSTSSISMTATAIATESCV